METPEMLTAARVKQLLDGHDQQRQYSCFQSAVEMVLKLYRAAR